MQYIAHGRCLDVKDAAAARYGRAVNQRPDDGPEADVSQRAGGQDDTSPGSATGPTGAIGQNSPESTPDATTTRLLPVRRAPRYGAFLLSGGTVGVLLALISGLLGTGDGSISRTKLIGYLVITLGLLGTLLGGAVAVVIERFSRPPAPLPARHDEPPHGR
jgi:hypothetical protein